MQSVPSFFSRRSPVFLLLCFIISLAFVHNSCKKTDFAAAASDQDLRKDFFTPTAAVSKQVQGYITILKQENDRRNFVDALPRNIGRPIWEKLGIRPMMNTAARGGDSGTHFLVIPFAPSGAYLHGLLVAVPSDTCYRTTYYSKEFLNTVCHQSNKDVPQVESLLGLFMMMENTLFDRTDFYHIPRDIFLTNARIVLTDSTKIASMMAAEEYGGEGRPAPLCFVVPSGAHHPNEEGFCDWASNCGYCSGLWCGGTPPDFPMPGGPSGPPDNPPPPPGGGGGGGNPPPPPPPPPVPCDAPFYLVDPCNPPLPPEPVPPYNPNEAAAITIDTSITNNFPCFTAMLLQIPNINREAQRVLRDVFNANTKVNLHFKIGTFSPTDNTEAEATPGAGTWVSPGGTIDTIWNYRDTILINPRYLRNAAREYMAGVVFHEGIHAFINWNFQRMAAGEVDSNYIKARFPIFWRNLTSWDAQHEQMAATWVDRIAAIVKLFYTNPNASNALKNRVSNSIAWGGLEGMTAWKRPGRDTCRINSDNMSARDYATPQTYTSPGCGSITKSAITDLKLNAPCN